MGKKIAPPSVGGKIGTYPLDAAGIPLPPPGKILLGDGKTWREVDVQVQRRNRDLEKASRDRAREIVAIRETARAARAKQTSKGRAVLALARGPANKAFLARAPEIRRLDPSRAWWKIAKQLGISPDRLHRIRRDAESK
jgi:hypothetical protein